MDRHICWLLALAKHKAWYKAPPALSALGCLRCREEGRMERHNCGTGGWRGDRDARGEGAGWRRRGRRAGRHVSGRGHHRGAPGRQRAFPLIGCRLIRQLPNEAVLLELALVLALFRGRFGMLTGHLSASCCPPGSFPAPDQS